MRTVHSLLAIYGALDELVLAAGPESDTARIVERYLPGTTGASAGWFSEIQNFLDLPRGELPPFPTVAEAIEQIRQSVEGGSADSDTAEPLTKSEQSRLAFVLAVLCQLPNTGQIASDVIREGLQLVVPPDAPQLETAEQLFDLFQERFEKRDDWTALMSAAVDENLIDHRAAQVPLCRTRLKRAHGHDCVVLTTDFTFVPENSDDTPPSLDKLKDVVDPLNWARCLPFFCRMQKLDDRPDGWSRVLEVTSTTCKIPGTPVMSTPLKYWKGPPQDLAFQPLHAWLNYELDDTPESQDLGDGLVLVDEGYIKMYSTNVNSGAPGIRVVTKKVVSFKYLSEVAIAILACVSGYGSQGVDMLLDGVAQRAEDEKTKNAFAWTDWSASKAKEPGQADKPESGGDDVSVPSDPNRPSRQAIAVAMTMATECIDDYSAKSTAIAGKMMAGKVPIPEMIALNAEFTARLITDPWRYLERLRDERRTGK